MKVTAVVVTYNRRHLLEKCLTALIKQSLYFDQILVINNASIDGTEAYIKEQGLLDNPLIKWINLAENTGGAGGFSEGMKYAITQGADWVWMMDDDAIPNENALSELMKIADDPTHVYASLAVLGAEISWTMTIKENEHWRPTNQASDITPKCEVQSLPFLGFMVHRELIQKIGLPDKGFFIAADDLEYCLRAKKTGSRLYLAGHSIIEHPKAESQYINLFGKKINYVSLPAWKRYYDTRNRIFIAKKYFGSKLYTQTMPSILFRLILSMLKEKQVLKQLCAYYYGIRDGIFQKSGKQHENYRL